MPTQQEIEFLDNMTALLGYMQDSYISANLRKAIERMRENKPLPIYEFIRDPANVCTHEISLNDYCDRCNESYGNNRSVKGSYLLKSGVR